MIQRACPQEEAIQQLLQSGGWPQAATPDLRAHALHCPGCRDLVLVRQSLTAARAATLPAPRLPSSGVLWWRAHLRQRAAAMERLHRSILLTQVLVVSLTLLIAGGVFLPQAGSGWQLFSSFSGWLTGMAASLTWHSNLPRFFELLGAEKGGVSLLYLLPGCAMLALLGGVVAYLAAEKQ